MAEIPPRLPRWPDGWVVEHVASTGSTNDDLVATATARSDRSVLVADHQTAGRGRLDRRWEAPPGRNLLVSLLFHIVPERPHELTRRVALAAVATCRTIAGVEVTLKWPNDLLLGPAKLAGILAQRTAKGSVVVGLGLNVGWSPPGAARLGDGIDPLKVLAGVLTAYDELPADVDDVYRRRLSTIGQHVHVDRAAGALTGTAIDVDADGRLLVMDDHGVTHHLDVGDVTHVRVAR